MKSLRVIVLMVEPPLPFGNAAARWFYVLLKGLVERGHQVTAFASCSKVSEVLEAREYFPEPEYDLRCYPHPLRGGISAKWETFKRPFSYMFSEELKWDLKRELAEGFDILHLEQLWSGWLGMKHTQRALLNIHYLPSIDLAQVPFNSIKERLDHMLRLQAEHRLVKAFPYMRSLSAPLAQELKRQNPAADVTTVPLALDPKQYAYVPNTKRVTQPPVVSLIGSFSWYPTRSAAVRFLTRLWPAIKKQVPEARAQLVGWDARKALKEYLHRQDLMEGVDIVENAPDIQPFFTGSTVLLYAPTRGSGMKIKVLEALAWGIPVVTTIDGIEGIPAEDKIHAGVADDDEGLVDRTVALLKDVELQNAQRKAGRALLEKHCGPEPVLDGIESIYARMLREDGTK